jgi:SAM-dependent methyltransferase
MLEVLSPVSIDKSTYRRRLAEAGIKGGWNYVLDHAWLFEHIDLYLKETGIKLPLMLDVGCGNSMFHPFLEKELEAGIIGIDRIDGFCPLGGRSNITDFCIDFREFSQWFPGIADIVFWTSSIEHNNIEAQRESVEASLKVLKPGGLFLATFGHSPQTHWFEPSEQTNLSYSDAEWVFKSQWRTVPNFEESVAEYKLDLMELDSRHSTRYGTQEYSFIVAGATIRNGTE